MLYAKCPLPGLSSCGANTPASTAREMPSLQSAGDASSGDILRQDDAPTIPSGPVCCSGAEVVYVMFLLV